MTRWKTLVVEDEALTQEHISQMIDEDSELQLIGKCSGVREAISAITKTPPDLILLDIQLSDGNSFEILKKIKGTPAIIFVTAYDRYAIQAFEKHAVDYVLKPFDQDRLLQALERAKTRLKNSSLNHTLIEFESLISEIRAKDQFPIKVNNRVILRKTDEITWIEAQNSEALVHFGSESFLTRESLSSLDKRLSHKNFVRVHRSALVNLGQIAEVQKWFHGDFMLILRDGSRVKLSRRYRENLEARLGSNI
ncbi:response regulator transcription factor [Candidatus Acetothermia bacterium]|nr:response regulator transcription factor [Candidatus Acetothermia bacterium]MBI3642756.1 response regulator transcription factor [Candidatus Acetothermia bacterium]